MFAKDITEKSFWALPVPEALDALETSQEGLEEEEAKERLKIFGTNSIPEKARTTKLKIFLNPIVGDKISGSVRKDIK